MKSIAWKPSVRAAAILAEELSMTIARAGSRFRRLIKSSKILGAGFTMPMSPETIKSSNASRKGKRVRAISNFSRLKLVIAKTGKPSRFSSWRIAVERVDPARVESPYERGMKALPEVFDRCSERSPGVQHPMIDLLQSGFGDNGRRCLFRVPHPPIQIEQIPTDQNISDVEDDGFNLTHNRCGLLWSAEPSPEPRRNPRSKARSQESPDSRRNERAQDGNKPRRHERAAVPLDLGVPRTNLSPKPLDLGAVPRNLGAKPLDLRAKPHDFAIPLGQLPSASARVLFQSSNVPVAPLDLGAKPLDLAAPRGQLIFLSMRDLEKRRHVEPCIGARRLCPQFGSPLNHPAS